MNWRKQVQINGVNIFYKSRFPIVGNEGPLRFYYNRLSRGGMILSDDYGFATCPSARKAVDDFFADKPESIIELPTGQASILKR